MEIIQSEGFNPTLVQGPRHDGPFETLEMGSRAVICARPVTPRLGAFVAAGSARRHGAEGAVGWASFRRRDPRAGPHVEGNFDQRYDRAPIASVHPVRS